MREALPVGFFRTIDSLVPQELGIPSLVLMENAGRSVADLVESSLKKQRSQGVVCVFCGSGNNGGDGLVAARHLHNRGWPVGVLLANPKETLRGDAQIQAGIIEKMPLAVWVFDQNKTEKVKKLLRKSTLIIDALLGTGSRGEVREPYKTLIRLMNTSQKQVIAVDLPSGLDADTGKIGGVAVRAHQTMTFVGLKLCFSHPSTKPWVGQCVVADLGLPKEWIERMIQKFRDEESQNGGKT